MKIVSHDEQTTTCTGGASKSRDSRRLAWALAVLLAVATPGLWASADDAIDELRAGGHALVIRHALAPGFGDPANFRLGDCTTQRNLSEAGRAQARAIGDWLRAQGIERARVYSSQWCRCLETAELLELGAVTELPALNSFFEHTQDREPNLAALKDFFARQPRDGELIVLVTHQVTITAISGQFAASGTGVLVAWGPDGAVRTIEQMNFDR
jgi:phosphohistidine phosphatase SixA